ncbi:DUF3618 domain-containing protein [Actinocorallia sp. A-T 12471]|uniref:DUF3618 domain-containing protein n=1 Tax=Actinocorallia sp. A-T 12471 TaxID=3089813 RepID=UPI0029CB118A|nr:DUF3618 domain-containing protein [Actinocorallia sp. A-T 12471]MDX6743670.1 DUF3618 domain-containing protein [Actinocorallia sp. A-T 12471]
MADRNPDLIKQQIEDELDDLARNIDALAKRIAPGAIVHRTGERAREEITHVAHALGSVVAPKEGQDSPLSQEQRKRLLIVGGVLAAGVALLVIGSRRSAKKTVVKLTRG